jgi:hypothetical protein
MALTAAEKQKRYRERRAEKLAQAGDPTDSLASIKFSDWMQDQWSFLNDALDWAGFKNLPDFEAQGDTDPDWQEQHAEGYETDPNRGSIGRFERMADQLSDAAGFLAAKINEYKREQVAARIAQIETMDMSDLEKRKEALAELAKLNKLSERLNKKARYEVPTYRLKGE